MCRSPVYHPRRYGVVLWRAIRAHARAPGHTRAILHTRAHVRTLARDHTRAFIHARAQGWGYASRAPYGTPQPRPLFFSHVQVSTWANANRKRKKALLRTQKGTLGVYINHRRKVSVVANCIHCAHCGKAFTPKNSRAKFCSDACRAAAYRKRHSVGSPIAPRQVKRSKDERVRVQFESQVAGAVVRLRGCAHEFNALSMHKNDASRSNTCARIAKEIMTVLQKEGLA